MPRGDRRGPKGMGSGTGRGLGLRGGFDQPGYVNRGAAYGHGLGAGRGFGGGHSDYGAGRGFRRPYQLL